MFKPTGEARIALMSKKDLRKDLLEEILSWMPIDKNCKSPVVDLINGKQNEPGQHGRHLWSFKEDGWTKLGGLKCNNFWFARQILLNDIHMVDLYFNRHCDGYDSVFNKSMIGLILQGKYHHKQKKLWIGPLVNILEPYETNFMMSYDTKKYRAVRDEHRNIIGFKRIGVKSGKVISVISSIKQ
jgi:hypothetical protein